MKHIAAHIVLYCKTAILFFSFSFQEEGAFCYLCNTFLCTYFSLLPCDGSRKETFFLALRTWSSWTLRTRQMFARKLVCSVLLSSPVFCLSKIALYTLAVCDSWGEGHQWTLTPSAKFHWMAQARVLAWLQSSDDTDCTYCHSRYWTATIHWDLCLSVWCTSIVWSLRILDLAIQTCHAKSKNYCTQML